MNSAIQNMGTYPFLVLKYIKNACRAESQQTFSPVSIYSCLQMEKQNCFYRSLSIHENGYFGQNPICFCPCVQWLTEWQMYFNTHCARKYPLPPFAQVNPVVLNRAISCLHKCKAPVPEIIVKYFTEVAVTLCTCQQDSAHSLSISHSETNPAYFYVSLFIL